jgi:hypothetical protein
LAAGAHPRVGGLFVLQPIERQRAPISNASDHDLPRDAKGVGSLSLLEHLIKA